MPEVKTYEKGELIFREGDWGSEFYHIQDGEVEIYSDWGKPEQKLLTTLSAGKYFGEMGIIDVMPRSATAVAKNTSSIIVSVLSVADFSQMIQTDYEAVVDIYKHMSARLRQLSDDYAEACDSITAYVEAEEAAKRSNGLMSKIKKLIALGEKFGNTMV